PARAATWTSTLVARKAPFITSRRSSAYPGSARRARSASRSSQPSPASTSAPRIMSPAAPLGQSKYARRTGSADLGDEVIDLTGLDGGAIAVVDIDHGDSRRAGVEHGQERGDAAEGSAVADAGGHRDHRPVHQSRHHAGQ